MTRTVKCPTCRAETAWNNNRHRPFCSERCKLIDLGAWIEEKHRVPGEPADAGWRPEDEEERDRKR